MRIQVDSVSVHQHMCTMDATIMSAEPRKPATHNVFAATSVSIILTGPCMVEIEGAKADDYYDHCLIAESLFILVECKQSTAAPYAYMYLNNLNSQPTHAASFMRFRR